VLAADAATCTYKDRQGQTMLHLAAIFNNTEIVMALIEKGASVDEKNGDNETVIEVASVALAMKLEKMKVSS
jgi:ankyrin repeat protein